VPAAGIRAKSRGIKKAGITVSRDCSSTTRGDCHAARRRAALERMRESPHLAMVPGDYNHPYQNRHRD
jgi:hypothetical protein